MGKEIAVYRIFFLSPQNLTAMSCMNLLFKVVFQFSCCNLASFGQLWPQMATWKEDNLN